MKLHIHQFAMAGLAFLFPLVFAAAARTEEPPPLPEGIVVQTRGPVHEAYAEAYSSAPQPGPLVPKRPPDPIPEVPPDQKPEADNVEWISGYWAGDEDRRDFIWVSGAWRVPPPDRRWVAGHWTQTEDGWHWVPGLWASAEQEQIDYLTAPPESLDNGPAVEAPGDDSVYVPGSWVPRARRYFWRPGYWGRYQPGWIWVPARYYWTPAGYVFCDGYWDYPLENRGLLFAPVYFRQAYWDDQGWNYRPYYGIRPLALLASLFLRPRYGSYYFGDYYDPAYVRLGFQPWFTFGGRYQDPLFSYYRWHHRDDPHWFQNLGDTFIARRDGVLARPPRTLAEQTAVLNQSSRLTHAQREALQIAAPLSQFRNDHIRLTRATAAEISRQRTTAEQMRALSAARTRTERPKQANPPRGSARPHAVTSLGQLQLPPAPRASRSAAADHRPVTTPSAPAASPRQGRPADRPPDRRTETPAPPRQNPSPAPFTSGPRDRRMERSAPREVPAPRRPQAAPAPRPSPQPTPPGHSPHRRESSRNAGPAELRQLPAPNRAPRSRGSPDRHSSRSEFHAPSPPHAPKAHAPSPRPSPPSKPPASSGGKQHSDQKKKK